MKDNHNKMEYLLRWCYAHILQGPFEQHSNLQHIFCVLDQRQQQEGPFVETFHQMVQLFSQQKGHQDPALL